MNITISQGAISVHLSNVLSYNPNGTVQAGPGGVVFEGCTFGVACTSAQIINPTGRGEAQITSTVPPGTRLFPGDSLVVLISKQPRPANAASANDQALALVVVPYAVDTTMMRPPAIGVPSNPIVSWLRMNPIVVPSAAEIVARLPSVIAIDSLPVPYGTWACARPTAAALEKQFAGFCGELWDGWGTASLTPSEQHPGYGRTLAFRVSEALAVLCSTDPVTSKLGLAYNLTQWGIDLVGAFAMGRDDTANGGHMQARKALVVFSGHMLDVPWKTPSDFIPYGRFAEDELFFEALPRAFPWGWAFGYRGHGVLDASALQAPVESWSTTPGSPAWYLSNYMPHVCGAQVGTALAFHLMGCDGMGAAHDGFMRQWMQGPPDAARAQLAARSQALGTIQWGTDYSEQSVGFCSAAWRAFYR